MERIDLFGTEDTNCIYLTCCLYVSIGSEATAETELREVLGFTFELRFSVLEIAVFLNRSLPVLRLPWLFVLGEVRFAVFVCPRLRFLPPGGWKMHVVAFPALGLSPLVVRKGKPGRSRYAGEAVFLRSRFSVPGLFFLARPEGMAAVTVVRHRRTTCLQAWWYQGWPCPSAMRQPLSPSPSLKVHTPVHVHGGHELVAELAILDGSAYALHCLGGEAKRMNE